MQTILVCTPNRIGGGGHLVPGLKLGKGNDIFGVKMDKGVQRAELHTYPKNIEE